MKNLFNNLDENKDEFQPNSLKTMQINHKYVNTRKVIEKKHGWLHKLRQLRPLRALRDARKPPMA